MTAPHSTFFSGEADSFTTFQAMMRNSSPLRMVHRAEGELTARLTQRTMDRMVFATVDQRSQGLTVQRDESTVRRAAAPAYLVTYQLDGESTVVQGERSARLCSGDFAVTSCAEPHILDFPESAKVFIALVPHAQVDLPRESVGRVSAVALRCDEAVPGIVSPFLRSFAETLDRIEGPAGLQLARHLVDLTTTCLADAIGQSSRGRNLEEFALFARITDYITAHLADVGTTPQTIAEAHFISTRRLHALFHDEGVSVARWIRDRRLKNCRWDLAAPQYGAESVYAIAARWGFDDPAYFSRIFRDEFGQSPREWRRESLARASRG